VSKYVYPEPGQGSWGGTEYNATWYDSSWHFRKQHTVNAAAGAGTGYQVRINAHYLNGTDGGADVYFGGKCKGGFGDVRFTAMDGVTLLPYWMETPISGNATFWVKISDNLTTQSAIIYLYYGNPAANSTSNGTATFDFFDDFTTDTGWTMDGASISCGTLNLEAQIGGGSNYALKDRPDGYEAYRFRFRGATSAETGYWQAYSRWPGYFPDGDQRYVIGEYGSDMTDVRYVSPEGDLPSISPAPDDDEGGHVLQVLKSGSNFTDTWDDSLYSSNSSISTPETGDGIAFCTAFINRTVQIDWVFLAKYVYPEPLFGGWGTEEGSGPVAPSPAAFLIWGTQAYGAPEILTGGPDEKNDSAVVCEEIWNYIASNGRFGYCSNYWGANTQPSFVYDTTHYYSDYFNDAWVFYKGHSIPTDCPLGWCDFSVHRGIYESEGRFSSFPAPADECIQDFRIFEDQRSAGGFRHRFVFLWTCGYGAASELGEIDWGNPPYYPPHSWGMMASWMGTTSLLPNAWNNNDNSSLCFISFEPYSAWFVMSTEHYAYNYGDFAAKFFENLSNDRTVTQALNAASQYAFGEEAFAECLLNQGYDMPNPDDMGQTNVTSYMRIWGDGDIKLPLGS
jgi:hypothetical protein